MYWSIQMENVMRSWILQPVEQLPSHKYSSVGWKIEKIEHDLEAYEAVEIV